ncbi:Mitochondrial inner membrane protease atp23 [Dimargaris cristalligena]|nr:Mitochondrial inner membrane protease atp23 [Dimargaris cristalligena]
MSENPIPTDSTPPTRGGSDPSPESNRWRHYFSELTGMGKPAPLTEEERLAKLSQKEQKQMQKCIEWRDSLMRNSPIVRFMLDELEKNGCKFYRKHFVCMPCGADRSGGFNPHTGVQLCSDRFLSKSHMEDTIAHELIHAYDYCRYNMRMDNCLHHACTEIRAASLSGDCGILREFNRRQFAFTKQHQVCVRRRAILSVQSNPNCSAPGVAEEAVNKVFRSCFRDTQPFDEIY